MELNHEFTVDMPVERAWSLLVDVERIAPCMPGATLESAEDGRYSGTVKVKVGPVTTQYRGTVSFVEQDEGARRAVLRAEGRETKGQGNATATITAAFAPDGHATTVTLATDLVVTGRVAQFGRGVIAEVSARLLQQFVECLAATFAGAPPTETSSDVPPAAGAADVPPTGSPADERPTGSPAGVPPGGEARVGGTAPATGDAVDLLAIARSMLSTRAKIVAVAVLVTVAGCLVARLRHPSRRARR